MRRLPVLLMSLGLLAAVVAAASGVANYAALLAIGWGAILHTLTERETTR